MEITYGKQKIQAWSGRFAVLIHSRITQASWQVMFIGIASFILIQSMGWIGARALPPGREAINWHQYGLAGDFVQYDSGLYLRIAQEGYKPNEAEEAFFPLYPLAARVLSNILPLPIPWSGWLISLTSFLASGMLLLAWIRIDYGENLGRRAAVAYYLFPTAFFSVAFYAEPLFIVTSIASLYLARRGQFVGSGVAIALAGAARPIAFLLAIPYFVEFWQQHDFQVRRWVALIVGALIAPLGTLGYMAYLAQLDRSPSFFQNYLDLIQTSWKTAEAWPWVTLQDGINAVTFGTNLPASWFSHILVWNDLFFALLGLVTAILVVRRLRLAAALLLLIGVLNLYSMHGPPGYPFWSMPRRVASLAPLYPALALVAGRLPAPARWLLGGASAVLLSLLAMWFASGRWVA